MLLLRDKHTIFDVRDLNFMERVLLLSPDGIPTEDPFPTSRFGKNPISLRASTPSLAFDISELASN